VKAYINSNYDSARWFIEQFTNFKIIQEMLFESPVVDIRRFVTGLIYCAMIKVYRGERKIFNKSVGGKPVKSVLCNFINFVIMNIQTSKNWSLNADQYFQILARFASLGSEARLYLLNSGVIT
jgi:hypothetical protein